MTTIARRPRLRSEREVWLERFREEMLEKGKCPCCATRIGRDGAFVRADDPQTSRDAAVVKRINQDAQLYRLLIEFGRHKDLNSYEALQAAGLEHESSAWRRLTTLCRWGFIVYTGEDRPGKYPKHKQQVYRITESGCAFLRDHGDL